MNGFVPHPRASLSGSSHSVSIGRVTTGSGLSLRTSRILAKLLGALAFLAALALNASLAHALDLGDAEWIWVADQPKLKAATGSVLFRKSFFIGSQGKPREADRGTLEITADDRFEVFLNGRRVGNGEEWKTLSVFNVQRFLIPGKNVLAVRVDNTAIGPAGLLARLTVRQTGGTDVQYTTDGTWKLSSKIVNGWQNVRFNDKDWEAAGKLGLYGETAPWGDGVKLATGASAGRFKVISGFRIERVAQPAQTGPIVSITFDSRGRIVACQERGPLLLIHDADGDRKTDVTVLSDKVVNCQGALVHKNHIYAVGDGPVGVGLYRLTDEKGDGKYDKIGYMFKFEGGMSEHGPHAVVLGPDGMLYVVIGNHVKLDKEKPASDHSPYHDPYEGDLVQPRYEDAGGHAVGIKAPGGVILRTDLDGREVEVISGGLRNSFDLAFNRYGELFTFDSDMEWDVGLPWYKPTRICHVTPGADFGWRSGWAKWPDYYPDTVPIVAEVGRGSPTGLIFYDHYRYPETYRNALFAADWSQGRILAVPMKPSGATWSGQTQLFMEGRPLNVTDVEVGPDGWLYFSTGGRGTEGGIYRVVYSEHVPPQPHRQGIMRAIHQPQLRSAWSLKRIEAIKKEMGEKWRDELSMVAQKETHTPQERVRALEIMQLVGPPPSQAFLVTLSKDKEPEVRLKAAYMMGLHANEATAARLVELLDDSIPAVRRTALDSLVRGGEHRAPASKLVSMLNEPQRHIRSSAVRALQLLPVGQWQSLVLKSKSPRIFATGSIALLAIRPDEKLARLVVGNATKLMQQDMSDEEFVALLRSMEVALTQGKLPAAEFSELGQRLADEFPAITQKNSPGARRINRELVRLLAYLQPPNTAQNLIRFVQGEEPIAERLHAAFHVRFVNDGWNFERRMDLLRFLDDQRQSEGGYSMRGYIDNLTKDFVMTFNSQELGQLMARGKEVPNGAVYALARLPEKPDDDMIDYLLQLDRDLKGIHSPTVENLQVAIAAVLGRSKTPKAMQHLRDVFENQPDRRESLAMALAQEPAGENWPYLIRSLSVVEGVAAQEVLIKLTAVDRTTDKPDHLRQVIICGLQLGKDGGKHAVALLEKWSGQKFGKPEDPIEASLAEWQGWYAEKFPNQPPAKLPETSTTHRWNYEDIARFLDSKESDGDAARGQVVFEKAQCAKCHRFGNRGESLAPDLTTVGRRFHRKEIIQSVLFPSQVISDQYASKTVLTNDGRTIVGLVGTAGVGEIVVLQSNGEKKVIAKADIEEIKPNTKSTMPEGLFDNLTLEEIADLFAYLNSGSPNTAAARAPERQ